MTLSAIDSGRGGALVPPPAFASPLRGRKRLVPPRVCRKAFDAHLAKQGVKAFKLSQSGKRCYDDSSGKLVRTAMSNCTGQVDQPAASAQTSAPANVQSPAQQQTQQEKPVAKKPADSRSSKPARKAPVKKPRPEWATVQGAAGLYNLILNDRRTGPDEARVVFQYIRDMGLTKDEIDRLAQSVGHTVMMKLYRSGKKVLDRLERNLVDLTSQRQHYNQDDPEVSGGISPITFRGAIETALTAHVPNEYDRRKLLRDVNKHDPAKARKQARDDAVTAGGGESYQMLRSALRQKDAAAAAALVDQLQDIGLMDAEDAESYGERLRAGDPPADIALDIISDGIQAADEKWRGSGSGADVMRDMLNDHYCRYGRRQYRWNDGVERWAGLCAEAAGITVEWSGDGAPPPAPYTPAGAAGEGGRTGTIREFRPAQPREGGVLLSYRRLSQGTTPERDMRYALRDRSNAPTGLVFNTDSWERDDDKYAMTMGVIEAVAAQFRRAGRHRVPSGEFAAAVRHEWPGMTMDRLWGAVRRNVMSGDTRREDGGHWISLGLVSSEQAIDPPAGELPEDGTLWSSGRQEDIIVRD